uniref:Uncharacterized protein n=1 Tax=Rhizophora mucronata TaxID=61149 RepID=A0A2P2R3N9_RHIMU
MIFNAAKVEPFSMTEDLKSVILLLPKPYFVMERMVCMSPTLYIQG